MESTLNRKIAPEVKDFRELALPSATQTRLPNGITLHIINGGDNDVCRITIAIPGGEYESPQTMLGSIAMTSLQEGTKHHTGEQIANLFEYNGAWIGCSVSTHYSIVSLYSLNNRLADVLPQVVEMIFEPSFHPDAVSAILKRQAAKIEVDRGKVSFLAGETMRRMMYGDDSPMAAIKTAEKLLEITPEHLTSYHASRLDTTKMHVFIAGKLSSQIENLISSTFADVTTSAEFDIKQIVFPDSYDSRTEIVERQGSLQNAICMMIPSIGRTHSDYVPLRAAVTAFGGYFGSRLMMNIREDKGLTYGISSSLLGYEKNSFIIVNTQTDCSKVSQVIDETNKEIERLKDPSSYSDDEINRLRRFQMSNLAAVLDTPFTIMDLHQTGIIAGTPPDYYNQQQRTAQKLSAEMLADMARKYFDTSYLCTAIAGAK